MSNKIAKTLTFTAYAVLIGCVITYMLFASMSWGVFIAWPFLIIGFVAWAILLTIADKYNGSDKMSVYKRNQIIFLVLLLLIVVITIFSTVLR